MRILSLQISLEMKPYFGILFILLALPLRGQQVWDLNRCLERARKNNLQVLAAQADVTSGRLDARAEKYNALPALNAGTRANWNYGLTQNPTTGVLENQTVFGNSVSLSADMPLFNGFALRTKRYLANLNLDLARNRLQSALRKVQTDVVSAYLSVLVAAENLKAARAQEADTRAQIEKMRELVRQGARPLSDLKDLEAQGANDHLQTVQAQNNLAMARLQLGQLLLLEHPDSIRIDTQAENFPVSEKWLLFSPDSLFNAYLDNQPDVRAARIQYDIAGQQLRLSRSGYYPGISAFANWNSRFVDRPSIAGVEPDPDNPYRIIGITENTHERVLAPNYRRITGPPDPYFTQLDNNKGFVVGISVNIPIFNRFKTRYAVRKAGVAKEKARWQIRQQEQNFRNLIYRLHTDARNARAKRDAARKSFEAARTAYDYAREKLDAGIISPYDFSNIKTRKMQAEARYISAKYEYLLKLKLLEMTLENPQAQ